MIALIAFRSLIYVLSTFEHISHFFRLHFFPSTPSLLDGIKPDQMARKKQPNKKKASKVTNNISELLIGSKHPGIGRRSGKISKI